MSDLWNFALTLYRQPGVEPQCLELQDHWGADVTLLLWLRWLEKEGIAIDQERLDEALQAIADWRQRVVEPLRTLRREIKRDLGPSPDEDAGASGVEACRQSIKQAELRAERVTLETLSELARPWMAEAEAKSLAPGSNLRSYTQRLSLPETKTRELIDRL